MKPQREEINRMETYRYKVDFSKVNHFIEIHEVLKRDLDFPDYYGGNLDALWDCLTDQLLSGITYIEFCNTKQLSVNFSKEWKQIVEIFKETKHAYKNKYADKFLVTIIHEDGTREELK